MYLFFSPLVWFPWTAQPHQEWQPEHSTHLAQSLQRRNEIICCDEAGDNSVTASHSLGRLQGPWISTRYLAAGPAVIICPFVSAFVTNIPLSAHPQPTVGESSSAALGLEICQIQAAASLRKALKSWQYSLLHSLLQRVCWSPLWSGIKTFRAAPAKQNTWQQPASTSGLWRAPECIWRDEIHTIPSLTRHC